MEAVQQNCMSKATMKKRHTGDAGTDQWLGSDSAGILAIIGNLARILPFPL